MGKGLDTGKAFYQGLLSKITDPGQRQAAEALLSNEAFITELGNGVEGQSEIDRQLQTLKTQREELESRADELDERQQKLDTWHGSLTTWWNSNKDKVAAADAGGGTGGKKKDGDPPTTTGLTQEQLDERIVNERAGFLGFQRDQNLITREHFARFGEVVDINPLLVHPQIATLGLIGVYNLVHKERLDQWQAADAKKKEDAIRADERQKVQAATAQMPYPTPTGAGSGSPLDALTPAAKDSVVDAATAHYNRLSAERAGAGA